METDNAPRTYKSLRGPALFPNCGLHRSLCGSRRPAQAAQTALFALTAGRPSCRRAAARLRCLLLVLAVVISLPGAAVAQEFSFDYKPGDKFRFLSRVDEDVYINRRHSHSAQILNRIAFEATELREDGAALLKGDFSTSVRSSGGYSYVTDRIYRSEYWQLPDGRYEIGPQYYMPTVRHVPTFPARPLQPGDTWNAPGEERHDFRSDFGIPEPYVIPIDVRYSYKGAGEFKGKPVQVLTAAYTIFYQAPRPQAWTITYPIQIAGYSDMVLYWNQKEGGLIGHESSFRFVFDMADGRTIEYRGVSDAEMIEAVLMDRNELAEQVRDAVADLKDVTVTSDERGVTIGIENIQFAPDSARLLPGEDAKIQRIAQILSGIPEHDIMISGHTALAGTAAARLGLSRERATVVAEMLIALGARDPEKVTVIGYGAERPIADNASEAGRARNRRVEITILEN
jgi:outer membrane protein OmpA-like peptidoglycan-associated protein